MKRLLWGALLFAGFAACASSQGAEAEDTPRPPNTQPDGGEPDSQTSDVRATDARGDTGKPSQPQPDASFVAKAPTMVAMTPMKALAGGNGPTLVITGTNFVSWSIVREGGGDLPTTFVSETELHAQLPAVRIQNAGILQIDVFTAPPGGGKSQALNFTVENPVPVLTSLAPSSVQVGSGSMVLTLNGSSFAKSPHVTFDTTDLAVVSADPNTITATVPATLLSAAGTFPVRVGNDAPGGGNSATISFTVTNPAAVSITTVTPSMATVGSADLPVAIDGSGFVGAPNPSVVSFNGTNIAATITDPTHITATIPAALMGAAGSFPIVVTTPPPGGGVSNPAQFDVKNPAPVITNISPNTAYYGGADRMVTVNGTGFVPQSAVNIDGTPVTTTYVNPTRLDATVPASMLAQLGTRVLTVHTPGPGGGDSQSTQLFVVCDPTGVDVTLGPIGNLSTVFTDYSHSPSAAPLVGKTCPTTASTSPQQPQQMWVVQNNQSTPVYLSAWAVCSSTAAAQDDAFLAIYKRPAPPATDAERLQCATVVAEGTFGDAGDYHSPESGGSNWCPGLTKDNNGGIQLAACERAVVWSMPYSMTSTGYTPPVGLRFKAE